MTLVLLASIDRGEIKAQRSEVTYPRSHSYERLRQELNPVSLILESTLFTTVWGCLTVTAVGNAVRSLCWEGGWPRGLAGSKCLLHEAGWCGESTMLASCGIRPVTLSVLLCAHLKNGDA